MVEEWLCTRVLERKRKEIRLPFLKDGKKGGNGRELAIIVRSNIAVVVDVAWCRDRWQGKRQMCRAIQNIRDAVVALNVVGVAVLATVLVKVVVGLHERGQAGLLLLLLLVELRVRCDSIAGRARASVPRRSWGRVRRCLEHARVAKVASELLVTIHVVCLRCVGWVDGRHPGPGGVVDHWLLGL